MIPYSDFTYFGVLLYVVVPALVLGSSGLASRRWVLIATGIMLAVQYGGRIEVAAGREMRELWIVAAYALFQWAVTLGFLRLRARTDRRWPFHLALFLALLPLVVARGVASAASGLQIGFLGISYVTFRCLDVIICIQDRLISSVPAGQLFAYLFFFATISSGPIDRYRRFETDWQHRRTGGEFLADLDRATQKIFTGFLYKFIIAALIRQYWLDPVAARSGVASTVSYMYAYSFHLFFDFAGYSAFAIGVSHLFGVHTPENFARPFLSRNIREFWNRWHITLSWWLRDHVYMRFVMAAVKGQWFRSRELASVLGLLLTFGLMGLWHGTAVHYLMYGLYHGLLLALYERFARRKRRQALDGEKWWGRALAVGATFHLVCFGFLLFSGRLTAADVVPAGDVYEGALEKADCDEVGGWAWNAAERDRVVSVDIIVDGAAVGSVRADLFRQDLAAAGKGNGSHAFLFRLPARVKDGSPHRITARIAGSAIELQNGARALVCRMNVKAMDGRTGALERADCDIVSGWAWDATRPDAPIRVDLYDGETLLDTITADQFRPELLAAGRGSGRHGFAYLLPAAMKDGQPHSISVHVAGTNVALTRSPQLVICARTAWNAVAPDGPRREAPGVAGSPLPTQAPLSAERGTAYADNRDGTISAPASGLMWEKKVALDGVVDAANLHDTDNCYPWQGSCARGGGACVVDADCGGNGPCQAEDCQADASAGLTIFKWVERLNAQRFAGYADWRLPTSRELYTISDPLEQRDPAASAAFQGAGCGTSCLDLTDPACSCTADMASSLYWAVDPQAPEPDQAWMTLFYCHGKLFLDLKRNKFHVRAVRGQP